MKNKNNKKRLYMLVKSHRLSRLIHGSTIGYGRLNVKKQRKNDFFMKNKQQLHEEDEDEFYGGGGFIHYGNLNADYGWNEAKVKRLLDRNVPLHELGLPNEPPPRIDARYLATHLGCLPNTLHRNLLKQGIRWRGSRVERYFIN